MLAGLLAATGIAVGSSGNGIGSGAVATRPAERDVQYLASGTCDLTTVESLGGRHPGVRQFVVLATAGFANTFGSAFVAVRMRNGEWACQTEPTAARFGRTGTRPLLERRSGDGTTPAGVFPLGEMTAWDGETFNVFGNRPDPGVHNSVGYRDVLPEDCWGATPNTTDYQRLVNRPGCPGPDDEWLTRFGDVYAHAAVIGANLDPVSGDDPGEPALAAAIFLHRHTYARSGTTRPTSGCVSVALDDLTRILTGLDPGLNPHFAIGPVDWLRSAG
jgi:L,D-peptidoglycan transpeptidase YkuD (ErfK/YbiS/YcfS/YnhG family)